MKHQTINDKAELFSPSWPMGTVIQEIHTGECCEEPNCDFYQPLWEMGFMVGWCRAGKPYNHEDDEPQLPVRVLYNPAEDDQ